LETVEVSLDYFCYAQPRSPLSPRRIAAACPDWLMEFMDAGSGRPLHKARALPSYCHVWGCPRSSRIDLGALIRARDGDRRTALSGRGAIGSCELEVEPDFEADPDFLADLPPRYRSLLAAARSRYETRTAAGRGDLSWRLQIALCRAIALAAGGLLEDPQMGTFRTVPARK
jgi:hypothetical protein